MKYLNDTKKLLLSVIALGISLALIFLSTLGQNQKNNNSQQTNYGKKIAAPQGQIVSGFPTALLNVDPTAKVSDSFSIPYQKFGQYTASLVSAKSVADEYKSYSDYLKANGFKLVSNQLKSNVGTLYAVKSGADINIRISKGDNAQTSTLVTYLAK